MALWLSPGHGKSMSLTLGAISTCPCVVADLGHSHRPQLGWMACLSGRPPRLLALPALVRARRRTAAKAIGPKGCWVLRAQDWMTGVIVVGASPAAVPMSAVASLSPELCDNSACPCCGAVRQPRKAVSCKTNASGKESS